MSECFAQGNSKSDSVKCVFNRVLRQLNVFVVIFLQKAFAAIAVRLKAMSFAYFVTGKLFTELIL